LELRFDERRTSVAAFFRDWFSSDLFFPSFAAKCSANPGKSETFASITKVQPPESTTAILLAGIELTLEEHFDQVAATLRDYEGPSTPPTTKLEGTIRETGTGCKVRLSGRNSRGKWK
jgi:hypothetical protein